MDVRHLFVGITVVMAMATTIPTPAATPGESSSLDARGFPAGETVWGTLNPGPYPLGVMRVSSHGTVTAYFPVWAPPGRDEVDLVVTAGRRETVSVNVETGLLTWPITMRLRGPR